jgi:hypothetical protein
MYGRKYWYNKNSDLHRRNGPAIEYTNGNKYWFINGKSHRLDGPAVEYANGSKEWWVNGKLHRLDGPAVEYANGSKEWWIDDVEYSYNDWRKEVQHRKKLAAIHKKGSEDSGLNIGALTEQEEKTGDVSSDGESTLRINTNGTKIWRNKQRLLHRRDGPAVEFTSGEKNWYVNGKLHRLDGPAIKHANGINAWYINNELHRLDGPAIEYDNGFKQWHIDGKEYSYEDWKKEVQHRKNLADIHAKGSEDSGLNLGALNEKKKEKHGDVSPDGESTLIMDINGDKFWTSKQGHYHRLDGPAIEFANGTKQWLVNGLPHRLDGPAIEWADGDKQWWINGVNYSYEDWKKEVEHRKNLDTIYGKGTKQSGLNLKGLTEQEEKNGDVSPDGESTLKMYINGDKFWRNKQGHYHRLDGPAIEWADGDKQWWINGIQYSYEDWKKEVEHRKNLDTIYGKGSEVDLNLKGFNA